MMSKYLTNYLKNNYKIVSIKLKKDEFEKFKNICKNKNISYRKFILDKIKEDDIS